MEWVVFASAGIALLIFLGYLAGLTRCAACGATHWGLAVVRETTSDRLAEEAWAWDRVRETATPRHQYYIDQYYECPRCQAEIVHRSTYKKSDWIDSDEEYSVAACARCDGKGRHRKEIDPLSLSGKVGKAAIMYGRDHAGREFSRITSKKVKCTVCDGRGWIKA